jgi:ABC-type microcin C transport system permease subunit YejB
VIAPARTQKRRDPDRDRVRPHDREASSRTGAVIERRSTLNGLGEYLVTAALNNDFATVQGISMVLVAVFVITNAIVDVLYAVLDPRVILGTRAR